MIARYIHNPNQCTSFSKTISCKHIDVCDDLTLVLMIVAGYIEIQSSGTYKQNTKLMLGLHCCFSKKIYFVSQPHGLLISIVHQQSCWLRGCTRF